MKNKFFNREANLTMLFDIFEIVGFFTILGLILFFTAILADKLNLLVSIIIIIFLFALFGPVQSMASFLREKYLTKKIK